MAQKLRRGRSVSSNKVRASVFRTINPYPWLPWPETLVKLELQRRQLIFSNRYFDPKWSPLLAALIPDYAPEFTLPHEKVAIILLGNYIGNIPSIIDRNAWAYAVLKQEHWTVAIWHENDILQVGVGNLFSKDLPMLNASKFHGAEILSPYGLPTFMQKLKQAAAGKRKLIQTTRTTRGRHGRRTRRGYRGRRY